MDKAGVFRLEGYLDSVSCCARVCLMEQLMHTRAASSAPSGGGNAVHRGAAVQLHRMKLRGKEVTGVLWPTRARCLGQQ